MKKVICVLILALFIALGCDTDADVDMNGTVVNVPVTTPAEDSDAPLAPVIKSLTETGVDSLTVSWNATADTYRLFVREEGVSYDYSTPEWAGSEEECVVDGLISKTRYYIVVRGISNGLSSPSSNEATFVR